MMINKHYLLLFIGAWVHLLPLIHAGSADDPPIITKNFYDPNYHDRGDQKRSQPGPSAASSSATISIISPYAAASSQSSGSSYNKAAAPSSDATGSGGIMAIVDHYYGPNGEERVQYTNPSQMDREELDHIIHSLNTAKLENHPPASMPQPGKQYQQYTPSVSSSSSANSAKYVTPAKYGGGAPLSTLYKASASPAYTTSSSNPGGFSLPSLYKSSSEAYSSKAPAAYRPAFSTIYKDPPYTHAPPQKSHYAKPLTTSEYGVYMHPQASPPKSINDALLADTYSKGYPPKAVSVNIIDPEESYYSHAPPNYPPPPPPPPSYHQPQHSPPPPTPVHSHESGNGLYSPAPVSVLKDDYGSYGKGNLKAGFQTAPVKYASMAEYVMPPLPPQPHDSYSPAYSSGYVVDEPVDSYRAGKATYAKRPPPPPPSYSSNSPVLSGGHSLSSLYEPLTFDDLYNSPKATYMSHPPKSPYSSPVKPYGHSPPPPPPPPPSAYMSYGPHVEYSMPPKTLFSTSGSPYGSGGPLGGPKYKGPYRTVNTGPSGFASYGYASSYGKPHYTGYTTSSSSGHPHDGEDDHRNTNALEHISLAKDEYEDEPKYKLRKPHVTKVEQPRYPSPPPPPPPPPQSLPPLHELIELTHTPSSGGYEPQDHELIELSRHNTRLPTPPPTGPSGPTHYPAILTGPSEGPMDLDAQSHLPPPTSSTYSNEHLTAQLHPIAHHHHHQYSSAKPESIINDLSSSPPSRHPHFPPRGESGSDEIVDIHVFEKGFFDKEKRLTSKLEEDTWKPLVRNYANSGTSSISLEKEANLDGAIMGGGITRLPPPSRRTPLRKPHRRPYHSVSGEEPESGGGSNSITGGRRNPLVVHHFSYDKRQGNGIKK